MSVVSVGAGPPVDELDRLTLAGQGNRRSLTNPNDAKQLVDKELSAVSRVIARAVRLRIRLKPGVKLVNVLGSRSLSEAQAERVRKAEQSIDQRMVYYNRHWHPGTTVNTRTVFSKHDSWNAVGGRAFAGMSKTAERDPG